MKKNSIVAALSSQGVLIALALLLLFGWMRYDNFLGLFNISTVLRYNSMFALVALGMCFVIMTGGIDLSVGSVAALGSVVSALFSTEGMLVGTLAGVGAGLVVGRLPAEHGAAPLFDRDAEVAAVPLAQTLGVGRLEKHAADACDSFHVEFSFARGYLPILQ